MNEKIRYLIDCLLDEMPEYRQSAKGINDDKILLRSLMNVRPPLPLSDEFLRVQDEYLSHEREAKGVVDAETLPEIQPHISLWQGDITRLKVDAIVNAANSLLLGCFIPCHRCIDNAIHSASGLQLRDECHDIMMKQGHEEPTGKAKITRGYNLPAKHVIHTVGPIVESERTSPGLPLAREERASQVPNKQGGFRGAMKKSALTDTHRRQLESCYRSCLELADSEGLRSLAFCCISTGEFHFPNDEAAHIAVRTVKDFLPGARSLNKIIFNVFKDLDLELYRKELSQ